MILYTTRCPKCRILEVKLTEKSIPFELEIHLPTILLEAQEAGINSVPFVKEDDKYYTYEQALQEFI